MRDGANAALELPREGFDDARDLVRHALQRANDWKALYGVATTAESFARGDLGIHLHLMFYPCHNSPVLVDGIENESALGGQWGDRPNLCIQMQRHPELEFRATTPETLKFYATRNDCHKRDEAVLVGIVKLVKKKKGIKPTAVPSLVWLKRLDACPKPPIETLKESRTVLSVVERLVETTTAFSPTFPPPPDATYREGGEVIWPTGRQERKLPDKAVEGRTKIMGDLADENAPFIRKGGRDALNAKVVVACLFVELGYDNTIGVSFEEPLKSYPQGFDLALHPINLRSWPIERMHEVYSEAILGRPQRASPQLRAATIPSPPVPPPPSTSPLEHLL